MKLGLYEYPKYKKNKLYKNMSVTYVLKEVIQLESGTRFFFKELVCSNYNKRYF